VTGGRQVGFRDAGGVLEFVLRGGGWGLAGHDIGAVDAERHQRFHDRGAQAAPSVVAQREVGAADGGGHLHEPVDLGGEHALDDVAFGRRDNLGEIGRRPGQRGIGRR
jgi:hypothetical protein